MEWYLWPLFWDGYQVICYQLFNKKLIIYIYYIFIINIYLFNLLIFKCNIKDHWVGFDLQFNLIVP